MERRAWFLLACLILIPWHLYHVATHPQFFRPPLPIGDGPDYESIGYSLSIGKGFSFAWNDSQWKAPYLADAAAEQYQHLHREEHAGPTTARPPLVPLVLASIYFTIGRDSTAFAVFRCISAIAMGLAGSIAVLVAFDVTCRITMDRWTPRIAAMATMVPAFFDANIRTYAIDFLSEPLAMLWTTLFLWCGLSFEKIKSDEVSHTACRGTRHGSLSAYPSPKTLRVFLLALTMSLMIATRSMFVFWMPGIVVILILSLGSNATKMTIAFIAFVALMLSPWWIRNCVQLQSFMPMGAQGAPSIMGGYSDEAYADQGNWHPDAELRLRRKLADVPDAIKWRNLEFERRLAIAASAETRRWIRQHVNDMPTLVGMRLKSHWGPYFGKSLVWRLGMLLGVAVLLFHRRWEAYWLIGIPIVSSLTVMLLYETGGRFLVPLYALLYALAGVGVGVTLMILRRRKAFH